MFVLWEYIYVISSYFIFVEPFWLTNKSKKRSNRKKKEEEFVFRFLHFFYKKVSTQFIYIFIHVYRQDAAHVFALFERATASVALNAQCDLWRTMVEWCVATGQEGTEALLKRGSLATQRRVSALCRLEYLRWALGRPQAAKEIDTARRVYERLALLELWFTFDTNYSALLKDRILTSFFLNS